MKEELNLALIEKYPEIFLFHNFRGRGYFVFECGDGWYNILDNLFGTMTWTIKNNNKRFNELMEAQDMINNGYRSEVPEYLLQRIASLNNGNGNWPEEMEFPIVQQVKEKFGTLRIYVKGWDDRTEDLISFAENMSATICEECGNVGESRTTESGWVKTLCDPCLEVRNAPMVDRT